MHTRPENQRGFTLIELLTVIAIIGLLASILVTVMVGVRKKARDSRRIADIQVLNQAIQLYINETGHAPYLEGNDCQARNEGSCPTVTVMQSDYWNSLQSELSPYLNKLPLDPCGETCNTSNYIRAAYTYKPPSSIAAFCHNNPGCTLTEGELNVSYSVYAQIMEVASANFVTNYRSVPTFGYKNHNITWANSF